LPVIEKGKHLELPFIKYFRTKKIIITSEQPMDAHLDGEYHSARRLEIEVLPAKYLFRY
jgi:diacylglycerol kinase (ATP)